MRATFEFELPEQTEEYNLYRRGPSYVSVIESLDDWLRQKTKYESDQHDEEFLSAIQQVRSKLIELVSEIDA